MNTAHSGLSDKEPRLLLVDDDQNHCWALQRAFERRGYAVRIAHSVPHALRVVQDWPVGYATVDLRMAGPSGLTLIPRLKLAHPEVRIVVITGFASIATAVEAIKLGAVHYLPKPVDADAVEAAFQRVRGNENVPASQCRISFDRLTWEHIQGALLDHSGNVSAAARALGMYRRTLQRKLNKHSVGS
jgi:two-component system response regulator RegA